MASTISQKIDTYSKANLQTLKQEEVKTGRKLTKFEIAQRMLQEGKLSKQEYANWMNTQEGFQAQALTQQQKSALMRGSAWGLADYGGGEESYLDKMTSFSQKNPVEKQNTISNRQMKLNQTVAKLKKQAAELTKKFKTHIDNVKISEEDKNKSALELSQDIKTKNREMISNFCSELIKSYRENATISELNDSEFNEFLNDIKEKAGFLMELNVQIKDRDDFLEKIGHTSKTSEENTKTSKKYCDEETVAYYKSALENIGSVMDKQEKECNNRLQKAQKELQQAKNDFRYGDDEEKIMHLKFEVSYCEEELAQIQLDRLDAPAYLHDLTFGSPNSLDDKKMKEIIQLANRYQK